MQIPEAGKLVFLDSGWGDEVTKKRMKGELTEEEYKARVESIKRFERQLTDNGISGDKISFFIFPKSNRKNA